MTAAADFQHTLFARQPILDREGKLYGYELLFRSEAADAQPKTGELYATSTVLANLGSSQAINDILGGKAGFVNVNESLLHSRIIETLPAENFVLEILEHTRITDELVEQIKTLREKGYRFAIDDFVFTGQQNEHFAPVWNLVDIVKVDYPAHTKAQLKEQIGPARGEQHLWLAEKVETREDFDFCYDLGFDLFQGYFFAEPATVFGRELQPEKQVLLDLIQLLQTDAGAQKVEAKVNANPNLAEKLVGLADFLVEGVKEHINSVRQAIALSGQRRLLQWLLLLCFSGEGEDHPIVVLALQRARLMAELAKKLPETSELLPEAAFYRGLMSLLPKFLHVPVQRLLKDIPQAQSIEKALEHSDERIENLLELAKAIEKQDDEAINNLAKQLRLTESLSNSVVDSFVWAEQVSSHLRG